MKICHVGDIHLKAGPNLDDTLQALDQVSQICRERQVDLVLVPGDVFDGPSVPEERNAFGRFLRSLDCPTVLCKGNHEKPGDLLVYNGYSGVQVFERPALVSHGDIDIMILPWPERAYLAANGITGEGSHQAGQVALGDLIRGLAANRDTSRPLVVMGHLSVVGALSSSGQPMVGREIQVVREDLLDAHALICLNHIHKPQIDYAGSLTIQDCGEEDERKRVRLLDLQGDIVSEESIPIHGRRWITIEASVNSMGQVQETPWEDGAAGANVRYRYSCTEAEQALFDHAEITRRFADAHTLKIEPKVARTARVRSAEVAAAKTNEEKLTAYALVTGINITPGMTDKLQQLEKGIP